MPMWPARAAHAAGTRCARANGRFPATIRTRRCEDGEFLRQLRRTTVRTLRALPVAGADQDFAVRFALRAMKFVNRHDGKILSATKSSSGKGTELSAAVPSRRLARRRCWFDAAQMFVEPVGKNRQIFSDARPAVVSARCRTCARKSRLRAFERWLVR